MTRLEQSTQATIDAAWPAAQATRLLEELSDGIRTIDHHESAGYRLCAEGYGLALIDHDGRAIRCALPNHRPWRGHRFLIGRVLPWAALLRGFEVFHASAVTIGGSAVAFFGPSGAGKTSIAVHLARLGAEFLTDDVLAVERTSTGALSAHPGASVVSVRGPEGTLLSSPENRMGSVLGHDEKTYVELPRASAPVPLRLVYLLTQAEDQGDLIERVDPPDPRVLLGSTFVLSVQTRSRMRNQLEICAEIASSVPVFRVQVQMVRGAAELAELLYRHASDAMVDTAPAVRPGPNDAKPVDKRPPSLRHHLSG